MESIRTNSKKSKMKNIHKSILVAALGLISLTTAAQKDTTLTRQVMLEREYTPTLQDASKINSLPSIYEPTIAKRDARFVSQPPQISLANNLLGSVASGDIKTDIEYSKKRGYLIFGGGTNANLDGAFGYRLVNSGNDRLDISATHNSMNGDVKFADQGYVFDEVKAKYADTKVKLKYEHAFEPSVLSFYGSYFNTAYNYYGNSFWSLSAAETFPYDIKSKQNVDVVSFGAGLKSTDTNGGLLKYKGNVSYDYFKSKYGLQKSDKAPGGGIINLDADIYTEFGSDKVVGVKGLIMNQSFNSPTEHLKDAYHSFTNVTGTPYIRFEGVSWTAELGLNASALFDSDNAIFLSPNIIANVHVDETSTLYGEITGGVNNNTFLDILQENRYTSPMARVEYSKTVYDAKIGFKSGVVPGFEFDIFGGYKHTKKDHLFIARPMFEWGNMSVPVYANISTGHIGGLLKTNLIPYTTLSAKAIAYFYNVKYTKPFVYDRENPIMDTYPTEQKAWGLPTFTAELNADVKPMDQLTMSATFLFAGGRKAYLEDITPTNRVSSVSMNDITELNLRGEYQINDWVSVNARLNNILYGKYELVKGYTLQGFNILGGVSLKF